MFTGIITDVTEILDHKSDTDGLRLVFKRPKGWNDLSLGESIATNGVCLTVDKLDNETYQCHLIPETLRVSSFGTHIPSRVNLERAMRANDRLSGHFVQGHIDTIGKVMKVNTKDGCNVSVEVPHKYTSLLVKKGSVTIDGVSLTISECSAHSFAVALVPHTLSETTLGELKPGDNVNIEFDIIGKYVANIMEQTNANS